MAAFLVEAVSARLMGNARLRSRRGGVRPWPQVKDDILRHLKNDTRVFLTMMVEYYGMPSDPKKDACWPGRAKATKLAFAKKADCVQQALFDEIEQELKDARRFIPFVIMYEFQGLLFSDCKLLPSRLGRPTLRSRCRRSATASRRRRRSTIHRRPILHSECLICSPPIASLFTATSPHWRSDSRRSARCVLTSIRGCSGS